MRFERARRGFVSNPKPRGIFRPSEWRTYRFHDVRLAIRLRNDGRRNPKRIGEREVIEQHHTHRLDNYHRDSDGVAYRRNGRTEEHILPSTVTMATHDQHICTRGFN